MYLQTSLFPVRYAGGVANMMRSRMRSTIPTVALRVPSGGANARLTGQHTSTWFLTLGKAISMGFLGVVRAYIHIPPFLLWPITLGPTAAVLRPFHSGVNSLRHDHHTLRRRTKISLKFADALYMRRPRMQSSIHFTLTHMNRRTSGQPTQWLRHEASYPTPNYSVTRADHHSGF